LAEAIPMTGGLMLELLELDGKGLPPGARAGAKGGPRGRKAAAAKARDRGVARKVKRSRKK
jgi:ribonuclease R